MPDCIFCKIISGEIPSTKIYEDSVVYAFLDIEPVNEGHTLLIPKEHATNLYETPDETLAYIGPVLKRLSKSIKKALNADGINIGMNNDAGAGQVIFHAHIHIMPRFSGDGHELWTKKEIDTSPSETAIKIKNAL